MQRSQRIRDHTTSFSQPDITAAQCTYSFCYKRTSQYQSFPYARGHTTAKLLCWNIYIRVVPSILKNEAYMFRKNVWFIWNRQMFLPVTFAEQCKIDVRYRCTFLYNYLICSWRYSTTVISEWKIPCSFGYNLLRNMEGENVSQKYQLFVAKVERTWMWHICQPVVFHEWCIADVRYGSFFLCHWTKNIWRYRTSRLVLK